MEDEVYIPFFGGGSSEVITNPARVAAFIVEEDKIPLLLALSLYSGRPVAEIPPFKLVPQSVSPRYAAWYNEETGTCVVGTRGTSPTAAQGVKDISDDKVSLFFKYFSCALLGQLYLQAHQSF